jgi:hypothetical protein
LRYYFVVVVNLRPTQTHNLMEAKTSRGQQQQQQQARVELLWPDLTLPILLPILAYLNSLSGDFVHDDIPAIVRNPAVGGGDGGSLSRLLTVDFWGDRLTDPGSHKSFRPLTTATFRLTTALADLKNPLAFHSVNILLHAAVSAGLYVVGLRRLGMRRPAARLAAVLFALHPVHTEAVAGIVGRADLLAGLFMLASFYVVTGGGGDYGDER